MPANAPFLATHRPLLGSPLGRRVRLSASTPVLPARYLTILYSIPGIPSDRTAQSSLLFLVLCPDPRAFLHRHSLNISRRRLAVTASAGAAAANNPEDREFLVKGDVGAPTSSASFAGASVRSSTIQNHVVERQLQVMFYVFPGLSHIKKVSASTELVLCRVRHLER